MSKHLRFVDKGALPEVIPDSVEDPLSALEVVLALSEGFAAIGCKPAGSKLVAEGSREAVADPDWGSDLGEFVARAVPLEGEPAEGMVVGVIDLSTLVAEIDSDGEICAWNYGYKKPE